MYKLIVLTVFVLSQVIAGMSSAQGSNDLKSVFVVSPTNFFHEATMPAARVMWIKTQFVGEPLDLSENRPLVEFDAELAVKEYYIDKLGLDRSILDTHRFVANFFHEDYKRAKGGGLYMAFVPREVQSVTAQYSRFSNIAAHAMAMFSFHSGQQAILVDRVPELSRKTEDGRHIRLPLPQDGIFVASNALEKPTYISEVILSIESTWTQGRGGYNLVNGLKGWYINTVRVISKEARIVKTLRARKRDKITQFLLNFNPEEASSVWEESLRMSMKVQYDPKSTMVYHLIFQNCSNVLIGIYERAVGVLRRENGESKLRKFRRLFVSNTERVSRFYPILNHWALRHRGFFERQLGLLNETPVFKRMSSEYDAIRAEKRFAKKSQSLVGRTESGEVASNLTRNTLQTGEESKFRAPICRKMFSN